MPRAEDYAWVAADQARRGAAVNDRSLRKRIKKLEKRVAALEKKVK